MITKEGKRHQKKDHTDRGTDEDTLWELKLPLLKIKT